MPATHYDLLAIPHSATADQIRRAYRTLAKSLHPDVNPSADAAKKFAKLAAAYEVLSDPAKRKAYDHALAAKAHPVQRSNGQAHYAWDNVAARPGPRKVDISEIDDLYDTFFGKRKAASGSPKPARSGVHKQSPRKSPTTPRTPPHSPAPRRRRQS